MSDLTKILKEKLGQNYYETDEGTQLVEDDLAPAIIAWVDKEIIGANEAISNKMHGGNKPNYPFIACRNKLRAKQRKRLHDAMRLTKEEEQYE